MSPVDPDVHTAICLNLSDDGQFERMPIDQLLSLQPIVVAEPFSANQLTLFD
jgi:hypothetical protein